MSVRTVTADRATCEPPQEHRDKPFHWIGYKSQPPEPVHWYRDKWVMLGHDGHTSPEDMYRTGWRYVAPAVPPQEAGEP